MNNITISRHISWQKIPTEDFAFVYNIKTHKYYSFKNTELYIWNLIANKECISIEEIFNEVAIYYKIELDLIKEDIISFIDSLSNIGVITYG